MTEKNGNVDEMVDVEDIQRNLPVKLTDRERLEIGEDIAAAQMKAEQAELDKKAADEGYKGVIEGAYADVSNFTRTLRYGRVDRIVPCHVKRDYRRGQVIVTRHDTMEEIENRPMTAAERQMGMKFKGEEKVK